MKFAHVFCDCSAQSCQQIFTDFFNNISTAIMFNYLLQEAIRIIAALISINLANFPLCESLVLIQETRFYFQTWKRQIWMLWKYRDWNAHETLQSFLKSIFEPHHFIKQSLLHCKAIKAMVQEETCWDTYSFFSHPLLPSSLGFLNR